MCIIGTRLVRRWPGFWPLTRLARPVVGALRHRDAPVLGEPEAALAQRPDRDAEPVLAGQFPRTRRAAVPAVPAVPGGPDRPGRQVQRPGVHDSLVPVVTGDHAAPGGM